MTKELVTKRKSPVPSLAEVKEQVQRKYLGQYNIFGFGVRSKENAIRVYVVKDDAQEQIQLLDEIKREVSPYALDVIFDEAPIAFEGFDENK